MSADPEAGRRALEQRNPHAAQLAMLASAAVQIEPELLRALRLLIPNADAGAEADLWLSDLVESRSALAITLRADVRRTLQEQLAEHRQTLDAVAGVLARVHRDVSDVIRIEEQMTLESLRNEPGAKERIDKLLAPIVATMEKERHRGLARWAIRAFDAAPALAKETRSMWRLMRSSSVTRATAGGGTSPATPLESALLELPRRLVRLRLRKDALEIEAARRGQVVVGPGDESLRGAIIDVIQVRGFDILMPGETHTFDGYVVAGGLDPRQDETLRRAQEQELPVLRFDEPVNLRVAMSAWLSALNRALLSNRPGEDIEIPDTVPLMLEVAWDDKGRRARRVTMQPGETVHVPLRPRNVTVAAFNGEMFAIEPELELEDYAIVVGIDRYANSELVAPASENSARVFREWLLTGGHLPAANVSQVRTASELRHALEQPQHKVRRFYAYLAGAAPFDNTLRLEKGAVDLPALREDLRGRAEEIVLIVESAWVGTPKFAENEPSNTRELILANDVRQGALLPPLLEALSGAVSSTDGTVTASDVLRYVRDARPEHLWGTASDGFVLLRKVFTTATFHFPRAMFGATMHLRPSEGEPISTQIADSVELIARPARYSLAIPEYEYFRTLTLRPGRNDISLGWRFNGKWVIVAGTSEPRLGRERQLICEAVARSLADHGFGLFVGAYKGVDELAAQTFVERVDLLGGGAVEVFRQYVQESMTPRFKATRTVVVKDDFEDPLAEASALIIIGGKEGTAEYARRARRRRVPVFPIAATGGVAAQLAEASSGELSIENVSANDIAQNIVERIEGMTSSYPAPQ